MPNRRVPTALKLLHGNPSKRPLNVREPDFKGTPKCPAWLPKAAKAEWKRAYALLEPFRVLRATDQAVFAAYCVAFARWKSAEKIIEAEGQTVREPVVSRSGYDTGKHKIKAHPAVAIARAERASMIKAAALLGLDPSNRTRIQAGAPDLATTDDDDDDTYLLAN